jgi:hypothetical protein
VTAGARRLALALLIPAISVPVAACGSGPGKPVSAVHSECVRPADRATALSYGAPDGSKIAAVTLGEGETGILFANGANLDICSWLPTARELAGKGYRVLLFDFAYSFSASQEPVGRAADFGVETLAGVKKLYELGARRIVLIGEDTGALAVHVAAALMDEPPAAIVDLGSPLARNGVHVLPYLSRSPAPLLYVASRHTGPEFYGQLPRVGRTILAAATRATEKKLVVADNVDGDPPLSDYFNRGYPWAKPIKRALFAFIDAHAR